MRTVYHVTYVKYGKEWRVTQAGWWLGFRTKKLAIAWAVQRCHELLGIGKLGQVVIHGMKKNVIQREYTYGADPKRFKG